MIEAFSGGDFLDSNNKGVSPEERPIFYFDVEVLDSDIDGLGHTNNARYVNWCERAAWSHSKHLGLTLDDFKSIDRAMAVSCAVYDYCAPTFAGQLLRIATFLEARGSTQMNRNFEVVRVSDGVMVLKADWQLSCISLSTGKLKRLPKKFIQIYLGGSST